MSTSGFLRTVSPEMHTINLICTFIYKDVQTEQYISLQSAEIVKILLYLLLSRTILSQNTQNILIYPWKYRPWPIGAYFLLSILIFTLQMLSPRSRLRTRPGRRWGQGRRRSREAPRRSSSREGVSWGSTVTLGRPRSPPPTSSGITTRPWSTTAQISGGQSTPTRMAWAPLSRWVLTISGHFRDQKNEIFSTNLPPWINLTDLFVQKPSLMPMIVVYKLSFTCVSFLGTD